jgi:hypothetical protein
VFGKKYKNNIDYIKLTIFVAKLPEIILNIDYRFFRNRANWRNLTQFDAIGCNLTQFDAEFLWKSFAVALVAWCSGRRLSAKTEDRRFESRQGVCKVFRSLYIVLSPNLLKQWHYCSEAVVVICRNLRLRSRMHLCMQDNQNVTISWQD